MIEPTSETTPEPSGPPRSSSNRGMYIIIAGFVVALVLLLALNWN